MYVLNSWFVVFLFFFCQKFTKLDFILSRVCVLGRHQISLLGFKLRKFPGRKDCLAVLGSALRCNQPVTDGALPDNLQGLELVCGIVYDGSQLRDHSALCQLLDRVEFSPDSRAGPS